MGTGRSGATPDMCCSLSGAPSGAAVTLCTQTRTVHCLLLQTIVGAVAVAPHGTPDSPVNYSGVTILETRRWRVRVDPSWCTGHCPVAHQTVWCARPGQPSVSFAPLFLNPILDFLLVCVEPLAPVQLII
jgi:hypothetical protein